MTHGGDIYEVARTTGRSPEEVLDFSASINPLGFSKRAERQMRAGLGCIRHYPDTRSRNLTAALAGHHALSEDQILPGAGSTEFIYALPRFLPLRRVLIVTPAFSENEQALEGRSGPPCQIDYFEIREEDGFELNVAGLIFSLNRGYDALYLCNPNNPTGILTAPEDLRRILAKTEQENTWFFLDETFIDFIEGESLKEEAASCHRLVLLRSLTHFFALPGLRAGYLISNSGAIQNFRARKEPWTLNSLAELAAVESLKDRRYVSRTRKLIPVEREFLVHGLRSIPGFIPYPGSANYLLVQIHASLRLTARELRDILVSRGILIRDCRSFHHLGPYLFRIAVRRRAENKRLLEVLEQTVRKIPS